MSSLYLDHFGLTTPPFQITPDLRFFFSGGRRGDILSALLHVAQHEEGIMMVVAEVGSGKTLLARLLISRLPRDICSIYLANPSFSRDEILGAIGRDLGLTHLPDTTEARLAALQQELLRRHATGQRVLLVIDEAHAMPPDSLEEVRLLSNLETDQHKLLNIMLFGQPELDETLSSRRMRQVRDRVIHHFQLTALPSQEAAAYVDHRLRAAGWQGGALFSPSAMTLLVKASGGRARRINLLADKALLAAYASGRTSVQVDAVRSAMSELQHDIGGPRLWQRWRLWRRWRALGLGLVGVLVLGVAGVVGMYRGGGSAAPAMAASPTGAAAPAPAVAAAFNAAQPAQAPATAPLGRTPKPQAQASAAAAAPAWMETLLPFIERTQVQMQSTDLAGYTLQIAALPREPAAAAYVRSLVREVDSSQIYVQLSHYNGKGFVAVFIGGYPSFAKANAALNELPAALKAHKPIVRTWTKIRQDQLS